MTMTIVAVLLLFNTVGALAEPSDDCNNKNKCVDTISTTGLADDSVTSEKILDGTITTDDIKDGTITSADIATGGVSSGSILDNSVSTEDIKDRSIDNRDMAQDAIRSNNILNGTIRAEDLADGVIPDNYTEPDNVVTVAPQGGDYTSISEALSEISPTYENGYLIDVKPGVYSVNSEIEMKSFVHLRGSGRDVTVIKMTLCCDYILKVESLTNVTISGLSFSGVSGGLYIVHSEPTIEGNAFYEMSVAVAVSVSEPEGKVIIKDNKFINNGTAVAVGSSSVAVIEGNVIDKNYSGIKASGNSMTEIISNYITNNHKGILVYGSSSNRIAGNMINKNQTGISSYTFAKTNILSNLITENDWGIGNFGSSDITMSANIIKDNLNSGVWSDTLIVGSLINNEITGNGGLTYHDIDIIGGASPNISFNVFDTIGSSPTGSYNVKSDGTAW